MHKILAITDFAVLPTYLVQHISHRNTGPVLFILRTRNH